MVIKVLVVDDSNVMAMLLTSILEQQADIEIVGRAEDGRSAIRMAEDLRPDVITMDVTMPGMNGIDATREIMSTNPIPIIVISSHVKNNEMEVSFRALDEGAVAVLEKPDNLQDDVSDDYADKLIETVRSMATIKLVRRRSRPRPQESALLPRAVEDTVANCELVAIGGSTGAPQILHRILNALPADFPVPVVVVNHMARNFIFGMADWLARTSGPLVKVAEDRELLQAGTIYLAPDDVHLMVGRRAGKLIAVLSNSPPANLFRPSVTPLMQSVAVTCGEKSVGLILSGMGIDGAEGLLAIHQAGGQTFVQNEESCVVFGMPGEAVRIGAASQFLTPEMIAPRLVRLLRKRIQAQA